MLVYSGSHVCYSGPTSGLEHVYDAPICFDELVRIQQKCVHGESSETRLEKVPRIGPGIEERILEKTWTVMKGFCRADGIT
jgi:hypothetical protein